MMTRKIVVGLVCALVGFMAMAFIVNLVTSKKMEKDNAYREALLKIAGDRLYPIQALNTAEGTSRSTYIGGIEGTSDYWLCVAQTMRNLIKEGKKFGVLKEGDEPAMIKMAETAEIFRNIAKFNELGGANVGRVQAIHALDDANMAFQAFGWDGAKKCLGNWLKLGLGRDKLPLGRADQLAIQGMIDSIENMEARVASLSRQES